MTDLLDVSGRVAIVTGGGTGIGAATARRLAEHGADVVIAARTLADLERTSATVEEATGRRCLVVQTDVEGRATGDPAGPAKRRRARVASISW